MFIGRGSSRIFESSQDKDKIYTILGEKDKISISIPFWRAPRANRANVALGEATRRPIESSSANECSPTCD